MELAQPGTQFVVQFVFQIFVFLVTAFWVKRQVDWAKAQAREARKARELAAMLALFAEIGNEEVRSHRAWLLTHDEPLDPANKDDAQRALRVAIAYDRFCYLVEKRLVPEAALEFQQDEIPLVWKKVEPVIKSIRQTRPNYCPFFEQVAQRIA